MYVNPFVAGCVCVLLAELIGLVAYAIVKSRKERK